MKVILIGNGCSAAEYKLGQKIDTEFDLVIRMNRFVTKGFEEFVGSKTDVWAATDNYYYHHIANKIPKQIEGILNIDLIPSILIWTPNFKGDYLSQYNSKYDKKITHLNLNSNIEQHIRSKIDFGSCWPTLGLTIIYYCLLNGWDTSIYGFDNKSKKYKYIHYYDIGDPKWLTDNYYSNFTDNTGKRKDHDDNLEANHIKELIENKKIKYFKP